MTKPSAPTGDNTVAASKIAPISPTIAADSEIVDNPGEKLDTTVLPITRADSVKISVPEAQGPVRNRSVVMNSQVVPNAMKITRVDR